MTRQSIALTTICVFSLLFYLASFMRVPIIPLYAERLGASSVEVGIIAASFMVAAAALGIPMGYLSDRRGRRSTILTGMGVGVAASALLVFTGDVVGVAVAYTVAGVGSGITAPAISAMVGDFSRESTMARNYGWFSTALHVGTAAGPALGGVLAGLWGYASAFIWSTILGGVALLMAVVWLWETPDAPTSPKATRPVGRGIRQLNLGLLVALGWLGTFSIAFADGAVQPFFPLYATNNGIGLGEIGALLAVESLFNAVARIPMGYLSDRLGMRIPFIVAGMLGLTACTVACVATTSFALLLVVFAALGLFIGTIGMAVSASIAESAPAGTRGMAMGGQSTTRYAGRAMSPMLVGALLPATGYLTAFAVAAAVCVVCAIAYVAAGRKVGGPRRR